jgi:hypothetical protein
MEYPSALGVALTVAEFNSLIWENPAFGARNPQLDWQPDGCADFLNWHDPSYVVAGALLMKRPIDHEGSSEPT